MEAARAGAMGAQGTLGSGAAQGALLRAEVPGQLLKHTHTGIIDLVCPLQASGMHESG